MDTTFIAKELLDKLGAEGQQRQLLLSTMHGRDKPITSASGKRIQGSLDGIFAASIRTPKWLHPRPNLQINDVRFLKDDDLPRNYWDLSCLVEASADSDGLVRKVKVTLADPNLT